LHSKDCADRQACLRAKLRGGQFLSAVVPDLEDLDLASLRRNSNALIADFGHGADAALHLRESARRVLARVVQLQSPVVEQGPRAGRGITAADQIVGLINVGMPVDARLRLTAPAFVACE